MFAGRGLIRCLLASGLRTRVKSVLSVFIHDLPDEKVEFAKSNLPENKFVYRTHTCGELSYSNIGENVRLCGWMEFQRMGKFIILRDSYGPVQLLIPNEKKNLQNIVEKLAYESILSIEGKVVPRPAGQENYTMQTGVVEVLVDSLDVLNTASSNLPLLPRNYNQATESVQLKYRYLSLRYPEVQNILRTRSRVTAKMREYLIEKSGFVEIETPTLFKSTPGGAQEFIVPTRNPGNVYALVQSPQQFKQLLMVGGIDRYFQIARCYRDEDVRNDRQPEFTQLDIEMSFADRDGVISLVEELLAYSWPQTKGLLKIPFKRITYEDAMELYGTDKPDLRIPFKIQDVTDMINSSILGSDDMKAYALVFPNTANTYTTSVKESVMKLKKDYFSNVKLFAPLKIHKDIWESQLSKYFLTNAKEDAITKLDLRHGDVLFLAIGPKDITRKFLGKLRVHFADMLEDKKQSIRSIGHEFLWVTDFPLFCLVDGKLESNHHPFTQPHSEDLHYLSTDPTKVRGLHYDLVMNGSEIGGGSIRIHDANMQKRVLEMLNIDGSHLTHIIEALASGAPPHGGIALGLDRFFSVMLNTQSIKNVIAFPKTTEGRDMMAGAPVRITDEEKKLYHIEITNKPK